MVMVCMRFKAHIWGVPSPAFTGYLL